MNEKGQKKIRNHGAHLSREVGVKESRKIRARKEAVRNVWYGFAMSGMVGWSVAIPALLGIMLGVWIDSNFPGEHSWTLMLLVAGLGAGCLNAWRWISRENRDMHGEDRDDE
ncbi:MAG: AtpZ/AtpI family protein [Chlorobium sp.]|nr:AtpZ/AtpI family protein [Chlorobium sp.]MCW8814469.1 AtpZ/AtpI family protein [Chlorobium sp.]